MNIKLDMPEKFFEGEERCGYYVSPEMKRVWAVELDILAEFARVCRKHNLKWWIDSGTLLGAARHKGFIPWDDDVDICIMRKDYEYLLEIADEEFKRPYFMRSIRNSKMLMNLPFAKLHNEDTTLFEGYALTMLRNGFPPKISNGIFIDVFPLDTVPDDDGEMINLYRKLHSSAETAIAKCYGRLMNWTDYYTLSNSLLWKKPIKAMLHYLLYPVNPFLGGLKKYLKNKRDKSFLEFTTLLSRIDYPDSQRVAKMCFLAYDNKLVHRKILNRSNYNDTVYLPFEMMKLPAPAGYTDVLDHLYGNWHEYIISKGHGVFYDTEHPYTYYTQEEHKPEQKHGIKI